MARRPHTGPDGLVVVDKEAGWTSHDVVAKSRGLLGTRKVGHAGTLDPDATGVLLLGVGKATKLLRFLSPLGKSYVGVVRFGTETNTLDAAGEVTATYDMSGLAFDDVVRMAAERFTGEVWQIPPMVSARKVDGRRLHELARQGIEVEREARPVTISKLDVEPVAGDPLAVILHVTCTSGTYIRTLAADLGTALGGGAHLERLRRTAVGPFTLDDAVALEQVSPEVVRPMIEAVRHLTTVSVDEALAAEVGVGKVLERAVLAIDAEGDGPWAIVGPDGALLAVYEPFRGSTVKPSLVIPA
jgi:tRNA pseudouridine55 synthase